MNRKPFEACPGSEETAKQHVPSTCAASVDPMFGERVCHFEFQVGDVPAKGFLWFRSGRFVGATFTFDPKWFFTMQATFKERYDPVPALIGYGTASRGRRHAGRADRFRPALHERARPHRQTAVPAPGPSRGPGGRCQPGALCPALGAGRAGGVGAGARAAVRRLCGQRGWTDPKIAGVGFDWATDEPGAPQNREVTTGSYRLALSATAAPPRGSSSNVVSTVQVLPNRIDQSGVGAHAKSEEPITSWTHGAARRNPAGGGETARGRASWPSARTQGPRADCM
jgi:hypothetical protein